MLRERAFLRRGLQPEENISRDRKHCLLDFHTIHFFINGEKILSNVNVVVCGQVESENSSLPVTVRVARVYLPNSPITDWHRQVLLQNSDWEETK